MALQSGRRPSLLQGLVSAFKSLQLPKVRCVHGARALPATPAPRFQDDTTSSRSVQATPVVREVCGSMHQVKTSPFKLNLVARMIRGLSISDALAQVQFSEKKVAKFIQTTLLDTQRRAFEIHSVEPTNLHVVESFVGKGTYLQRVRYHGKGMSAMMYKYYAHYFLKLREGPPPPKKKRKKEDHKSFKTRKLIMAGPRGIPNSL